MKKRKKKKARKLSRGKKSKNTYKWILKDIVLPITIALIFLFVGVNYSSEIQLVSQKILSNKNLDVSANININRYIFSTSKYNISDVLSEIDKNSKVRNQRLQFQNPIEFEVGDNLVIFPENFYLFHKELGIDDETNVSYCAFGLLDGKFIDSKRKLETRFWHSPSKLSNCTSKIEGTEFKTTCLEYKVIIGNIGNSPLKDIKADLCLSNGKIVDLEEQEGEKLNLDPNGYCLRIRRDVMLTNEYIIGSFYNNKSAPFIAEPIEEYLKTLDAEEEIDANNLAVVYIEETNEQIPVHISKINFDEDYIKDDYLEIDNLNIDNYKYFIRARNIVIFNCSAS